LSKSVSFKQQSAVIPYRWRKGKLEILLITSMDTGRWVLPKGGIERDLTPCKSAEKEAYEEAGIRGRVAKQSVGVYTYVKSEQKGGLVCRVQVFPMDVQTELTDWPEKEMRTRTWMKTNDAAQNVQEKKLRKIISDFAKAFKEPG